MPRTRAGRALKPDPLESLARQLAESHTVTEHPMTRPSLLSRLRQQEALLRAAYRRFATASEVQFAVSYAAEWMLDNFYVVEQALRQVREDMPEGYYRQLPKLAAPPLDRYPRVYALALAIIEQCKSHLDLDRVTRFVRAYQRVAPLTVGELWALPTMLRLGVLEGLTRAVVGVTGIEADEEFLSAVTGPLPQDWDSEAVVAGCFPSLRMLATQDWKAFFENVSRVEHMLRGDPSGDYARMDFDTRNRYRGVIEEMALAMKRDEGEVAGEAIRMAEEAKWSILQSPALQSPARARHVGYYLLDAGRAQLEARLGYRPPWRRRLERWLLNHPNLVYLGGIGLFTLVFAVALVGYALLSGGTLAQLIVVGLLICLPASAVAIGLVNWFITQTVPPRLLPRLDFQGGVPAKYRTMVVIPTLLTDADEVESLLQQLELLFLGDADPHLHYALLADLDDAPQQHMPDDEALLEQARSGVQSLNKKYGQQGVRPFYLFYRERAWNSAEGCWMGWERKRGKLAEFNRLIGGHATAFSVQLGDLSVLPEVRYVITLDADTLLPRDSARRLIATLAHPLNQAEFDPETEAVVAGYTVLQPRVEVKPTASGKSLFARVFAGDVGLDLYTRAVSDVYQDLFGEGTYAGKGIYDVEAFERSLAGRAPENILLSHDLFEGVHGRAGLVTDVVVYEDFPSHYLAHARRLHRWVRGDWQILFWLFPWAPRADGDRTPNTLSLIDRWKILDNLRRSLLSSALLALLLAGWLWLPGSPLAWTLVALMSLAGPAFTGVATALRRGLKGVSWGGAMQALGMEALRWLLGLVFLLYESTIMADAVATTLHRMFISHKRLLQWTTAAHTLRLFGRETKVGVLWIQMGPASLVALLLAWLVFVFDHYMTHRLAFPIAVPFLLAWVLSPYVAYWVSLPIKHRQATLSTEQLRQLRRLARRTWLYFEQFVGPDDQWLPPDHFQEQPLGLVAHRTSPTNIGLLLLSTLSAYDLGYIGPLDFALRLRPTFETMSRLERHRGHLLNWYDTSSLKPLPPRYVSTVDSGNLAACLLVLEQGCLEMLDAPFLRWQRWQGLLDTLDVLAEVVEGLESDAALDAAATALLSYLGYVHHQVVAAQRKPSSWGPLLAELGDEGWQELEGLLIALVKAGTRTLEAADLRDLRIWSERVSSQLFGIRAELDLFLPWLAYLTHTPALFARPELPLPLARAWQALVETLPLTPRLADVPEVCRVGRVNLSQLQSFLTDEVGPAAQVQEAHDWCTRLAEQLYSARLAVESLMIGLHDLSAQVESHVQMMDFGFLFDPHRQVFHIGYNVESGTLDGNYYDLLASEARIASIIAIAEGHVPQSHWLHLSRPVTQVNGAQALLSWNGTMFEYMMPTLMMRDYEGTLLEQGCRAAVGAQIAYAHQKGVPWGISESGYYRFDAGMHYQYQGFGVPGLGFKRGLAEDLVIAPYASILALPLAPREVMQNIARLSRLQMLGRYGFYEAIDYTGSRLPPGQHSAIVRSYMVHHQGMSLLALTNYLQDAAMVRRFHADPRVQSVEMLLQEQTPRRVPIEYPHPAEVQAMRRPQPLVTTAPWRVAADAPLPQVHVLSNGRYSVLITASGSGCSRWQEALPTATGMTQGVDLTRWRADTTLDDWGSWIYVQDRDSGALWSAGYQPTCVSPESQEILFYAHKAEFRRRERDISLRLEVTVSPDDDVEVRQITLTNHSSHLRRLMLTSYSEVVLAPQAADQRHPAFNKLFIESEYLPDLNALLFRRRRRSADEEPIYLLHMLLTEKEREVTGAHESDRARFLGRGGTLRAPQALSGDGGLSGTTGATLDPIMALGQEVELMPHATEQAATVTLVAKSREGVLALARRYQGWSAIRWAFDQATSDSELELRHLNLSISDVECIQQLLAVLLYPHAALRAAPAALAANRKGRPGLWAHGISGDYPILLVRIGDPEEMDLVREALQAHAYWRNQQIKIDLVILDERDTGYDQAMHRQLYRLIARMDSDAWLDQRGGIFVVRADLMSKADRVLLETAARAILDGRKGRLAGQLDCLREQPARLPYFAPTLPGLEDVEPTPPLVRPIGLLFDNGLGGFSADGREYVIYLEPGQRTPAPWVNVVANPSFGFLVSEAGSGATWAENSSENRLTPWRNDPVADVPGEALYLRDEETAQVWSPTPLPAPASAPYLIRHGAGYSVFEHHSHGLKQRLRLFAVPGAPVKVVHLRLENTWSRVRRVSATFYAEWVLGVTREEMQQYVIPGFDAGSNALLARNPYNEEFGARVAFVAASKRLHGLTADRTEFLGRGGFAHPAALDRIGLASAVQAGLDPCAAVQVHFDLPPGEAQEVCFLLGQGANRQEALRLVRRYQNAARVEAAWQQVHETWDRLLGTVTVQTPDPAMDVLLNRWLLVQALSCRIWGRSALYQSSGAFGFRDQLQDVMALVHTAPGIAREHILRAARYQFTEGDVLHWWHPPSGRGARTRCSDDLLWLPFVTAHYVTATGDEAILTETVPFLQGDPLGPEEVERYGHYGADVETYSLYEHCCRALEKGTTAGLHGLPLIGGCDWNDGLNRVGIAGKGESVWLGWFLHAALTRFAPLCDALDDTARAAAYRARADRLRQALEDRAWDWRWYRRAYYDDGTPLGSSESDECQIDSIAQSWAVLSGAADSKRAARAMEAVTIRLVRRDDQLVLLFTPPFDKTERDPGYVKGYPPGVRENGGQYTHAALWAAWAFAELGQGERAEGLFRLLNPIYHSDTPEKAACYRVEPYVVAADVYSEPPHVGRGGWTWYTGSASWMYRLGVEAILGLRRVGRTLQINPCIPKHWPGYEVTYREGETTYHIHVDNVAGVNRGVRQVTLDGAPLPDAEIPLLGDGQRHEVSVVMG